MTDVEKRQDRSPVPTRLDVRACARVDRHRHALQERYGLYIGGEWVTAKEHFTTISPRDEAPLAEVAQASEADVHDAVAAARDGVRTLVEAARLPSARSTCSGSRASSPSARASSRCSSR